jgi:hypothetical protein
MIQYNWVISQLDTATSEDGLTDVVKTVHWTYQATEMTDDKTYQAYFYGAMACATPSETDFTAYPDLTEDQVISWVESWIDVAGVQASLVQQIDQQKIPPIVNLPLPWAE